MSAVIHRHLYRNDAHALSSSGMLEPRSVHLPDELKMFTDDILGSKYISCRLAAFVKEDVVCAVRCERSDSIFVSVSSLYLDPADLI